MFFDNSIFSVIFFCYGNCLMQFFAQKFFVGQLREILRHTDISFVKHQIFNVFGVALAAKYQTDWRFFALFAFVFVQVTQVEQHLPLVFGLEFAEFQINSYQTPQSAVVKKQVNTVIDSTCQNDNFSISFLISEITSLLAISPSRLKTTFRQICLQNRQNLLSFVLSLNNCRNLLLR